MFGIFPGTVAVTTVGVTGVLELELDGIS